MKSLLKWHNQPGKKIKDLESLEMTWAITWSQSVFRIKFYPGVTLTPEVRSRNTLDEINRNAFYSLVTLPSRCELSETRNPVEALNFFFFRLLLSNCLNWKIHCDDQSSLSKTILLHPGKQGPRSGEITRLPPMWDGLEILASMPYVG